MNAAGFMNRAALIKNHLQGLREKLCEVGRVRHGSFGISAMDLKKVLDRTIRELRRELNKKVLKVPEIEMKVCEATSNEPWGPHGTIMGDIAQATRNFQEYHMIMGVLWKRLHDSGKNWRHVYKSLTVMEYLIANGAERVIDELREQAYQIQALLDFQYIEPNGKDQGINVKKKAQSLVALINDRGKIRELRQKAAANRDKYRGLSNTGMTFRPSLYLSTSGTYSDKDDERYGGGSSLNAQKDDNRKEESRSQRESNYRDDGSCGDREHNEGYSSSKGDRNSDKSSTEGDRTLDIDEYRQYARCSGNRGVVAAETRAQTNLSQASSGPTSQLPPRKSGREIFFTIKSAVDDSDDFDPRGTSKPSVPVAKDGFGGQSQNALEDMFADVELQASFPPISAPKPEQNYLQTPYAFGLASKPNPIQPTPSNITKEVEFQPFTQSFPQSPETLMRNGTSFGNFNPSFSSFESPKSSTLVLNGGFHPMGDNSNFNVNESLKVGPSAVGNSIKTTVDDMDLFGSFNPFCTKLDGAIAGNQAQQQQPQTNPFLSTIPSSAFWDDPLITSLVDLSIGRVQKQDHSAPLSMNEIGINIAAAGSSAVSRANSLPLGATTTLSMARTHMTNNVGSGSSVSDLPK